MFANAICASAGGFPSISLPCFFYPLVFVFPGAEEPFDEAQDRVRGSGGEDAGDGQR